MPPKQGFSQLLLEFELTKTACGSLNFDIHYL